MLKHFTIHAQSYIRNKWHERILRTRLEKDLGTCIAARIILRNYRRLDKAKNEGPMKFSDRCKGLTQRLMSKVNDPVSQHIHRKNANRMCLASFVAGLSGDVGRQFRYAHPRNLPEALNLALAIDEAENQERRSETFYTQLDEFAGQSTRKQGKKSRGRNGSERSADSRTSSQQL